MLGCSLVPFCPYMYLTHIQVYMNQINALTRKTKTHMDLWLHQNRAEERPTPSIFYVANTIPFKRFFSRENCHRSEEEGLSWEMSVYFLLQSRKLRKSVNRTRKRPSTQNDSTPPPEDNSEPTPQSPSPSVRLIFDLLLNKAKFYPYNLN